MVNWPTKLRHRAACITELGLPPGDTAAIVLKRRSLDLSPQCPRPRYGQLANIASPMSGPCHRAVALINSPLRLRLRAEYRSRSQLRPACGFDRKYRRGRRRDARPLATDAP